MVEQVLGLQTSELETLSCENVGRVQLDWFGEQLSGQFPLSRSTDWTDARAQASDISY